MAGSRDVIAPGNRRIIVGGVVKGHRQVRSVRQPDVEDRILRPAVALGNESIVNGKTRCRVVVNDRSLSLAVSDNGVCWIRKIHKECLVGFESVVSEYDYSNSAGCLPSRNRQCASSAKIVTA